MNGPGVSSDGFRHFMAPRGDGEVCIDPPINRMNNAIDENLRRTRHWGFSVAGVSIDTLRTQGRIELIQAATKHTSSYLPGLPGYDLPCGSHLLPREPSGSSEANTQVSDAYDILLSGHQPQLFHPGVWLKNFALAKLAKDRIALGRKVLGVNLIVDNDLCGAASVRTLNYRDDGWHLGSVEFDAPVKISIPYEQRSIEDWSCFETFEERLSRSLRGWSRSASIEALWPLVVQAGKRSGNIGLAVAQGRHLLEHQLGLRTLEVPLSHLAQTHAFFTLMLAVFQDVLRFQECYNESLVEYRLAHRIRSLAHPVPALGRVESWLETPFWVYGNRDPRRRPLWLKFEGEGIRLSDLAGRERVLGSLADGVSLFGDWVDGAGDDFKVRPRALMTTMAARLLFGDYFLHGIGGAKYDQLGDRIVARFFGIEPPSYGVISGTVLLPIEEKQAPNERSPGVIQRDLRDTFFSPERFVGDESEPSLVFLRDEKHQLLQSIPPRGQRYRWHRQIESINHRLSDSLEPLRQSLHGELVRAREYAHRLQWFQSREWSFVIHPLDHLVDRFGKMLA